MLEQFEEGHGDIRLHSLGDAAGTEELDVQGGIAEHGEPDEGGQGRDDQDRTDELAHRAATRHPGDENADERRPGDPPGPVEERPAVLPARLLVGFGPEAQTRQVLQIDPDVLHQGIEEVTCRTGHEDEEQQQADEDDVDLAQPANALVDPEDDGDRGHGRDDGDEDDLHGNALGDAEQVGKASVDLLGTETERGGQPEQRRQRGQHVDGISRPTVYALSQQRVECRTNRERQTAVVGEIGQSQGHQAVEPPGVETPVEEGDAHGQSGSFRRLRLTPGWAGVVVDGLGDAPEHESDPHAGTEKHRQPSPVAVGGTGVVAAEAQTPVAAEQEKEDDGQVDVDAEDEEPSGALGDEAESVFEHLSHLIQV